MDLALQLDPALGRRAALEAALRNAVLDGRLPPGSLVPSTRALARDLGLARSTVVGAYEQLAAEGFLSCEQGRATRVGGVHAPEPANAPIEEHGARPDHDFRPGEPDGSLFPRQPWLRAIRRVLAEAPDGIFGYADPSGRAELRSSLAGYLGRTRAVRAQARSIVIVPGFASALGSLAELFARQHTGRIAVEDPMLFVLRDLLRTSGIEVVPVPVDGEGLVVERLPDDVDAALVSPAHQLPSGATLSAARRTQLATWARDTSSWIIEDDYDSEFRYDRRPIGALHAMAPDRVVYAGTASKMLAPGLRIGWLVVPDGLLASLQEHIHIRSTVSTVDQLALADFLASGSLDRHVRTVRARYRRRRDTLTETLADSIGWLQLPAEAAGLHLLATITDPSIDEADVVASSAADGVGVMGLGPFHADGCAPGGGGLVIGFSRPPEHGFAASVDQLVATLRRWG